MRISHEVVTILKKIKIFSTLTYSQLIQLSNVTEEIEVPAGNLILKEKESGGDLLIIVDGKVGLTFEGKSIGELEPYNLLGDLAVFDGAPHAVSSTALSDVVLFRIKSDVIYELLEDDIDLVRTILQHLCSRIRGYHKSLTA